MPISDSLNEMDGKDLLDEEAIQHMRKMCKESLFFLARAVLGFTDLEPKIHLQICRDLEDNNKSRKIIVMPRTWFKSTIGSISFPIWRAISDPNVRILICQNSHSNACKKLGSIKQIFEKNKLFRLLFPEILPTRDCKWSNDVLEVKRTATHPEGTFEAAGTGTMVVSRHYDVIIEDDTVAPDKDSMDVEMQQPTAMEIEKAIGWHNLTVPLLVHPLKGQIIIIGTRWAEEDLIGHVVENHKNYHIITRAVREKDGKPASVEEGGLPAWPERFNDEVLAEVEKSLGPYMFCTPGGAPVIMADWSARPISMIEAGDRVVGFTSGTTGTRSVTKPTLVTATGSKVATVVEFLMSSGRTVRCTPDHKWLVQKSHTTAGKYQYAPACQWSLDKKRFWPHADKTRRTMHFVCDPFIDAVDDDKKEMAAYFTGLYDGEGSCTRHLTISQTTTRNGPVYARMRTCLGALGFKYKEYLTQGKEKHHMPRADLVFGTKFEERRRFLLQMAPAKDASIIKSLYGARFIKDEDEVVAVRLLGEMTVYWIETETGNYISQGYCSKNSTLMMNHPTSATNMVFRRSWIGYFETRDITKLMCCTTIDPAASERETTGDPDYTVILTTGVDPTEGQIFVLGYDRERMNPGETIDRLFQHYKLYHPLDVGMESVAYQRTLKYWIMQQQKKQRLFFPVTEIPNARTAKADRIRGLQPFFSNRLVFIRSHMDVLERELLAFPTARGHDDVIDALSMQIKFWNDALGQVRERKESQLAANLFSGKCIVDELLGRSIAINRYPYDIGNMKDRLSSKQKLIAHVV